jgi:hypothetical protein
MQVQGFPSFHPIARFSFEGNAGFANEKQGRQCRINYQPRKSWTGAKIEMYWTNLGSFVDDLVRRNEVKIGAPVTNPDESLNAPSCAIPRNISVSFLPHLRQRDHQNIGENNIVHPKTMRIYA